MVASDEWDRIQCDNWLTSINFIGNEVTIETKFLGVTVGNNYIDSLCIAIKFKELACYLGDLAVLGTGLLVRNIHPPPSPNYCLLLTTA